VINYALLNIDGDALISITNTCLMVNVFGGDVLTVEAIVNGRV